MRFSGKFNHYVKSHSPMLYRSFAIYNKLCRMKSRLQRLAQALNAVFAVLTVLAVVLMIREWPPDRDFSMQIGLAAVAPSGIWFIALRFPRSFTAAFLALLANAVGMLFAMLGFSGFLMLGAATGTRADFGALLFCLIWLITGAMNIRTAWADRVKPAPDGSRHAT
jgi:hypothetical protein